MRLYTGSSTRFVQDTRLNRIAGKVTDVFVRQMGFYLGHGEVASWRNALAKMADLAGLDDHGVFLEYQLPLSAKRLDCMLTGTSEAGAEAVIVELKQSDAQPAVGGREVVTYVGVIFGLALTYDLDRQGWVGDKSQSHDTVVRRSKDQFVDLVKNIYRVLLTQGIKGCYVHFMDKDTERFVRSRIQ